MSKEPRVGGSIIDIEQLTKVYPSAGAGQVPLKAVDKLDLSVKQGEIFGLLGPNGAGKTTTVGMLTTRVVPTSGRVILKDVDVVADPTLAKEHLGVVQQVNTLDRSLNAWENLYFHGRYHGMTAKRAKAAANEYLDKVRLGSKAGSEVRTLSGGMVRRLMIARAILHNPAVVFLDEPTAGLDPQSRLALWEILGDLHAEGQTILLTTHYMEEADRFCDRVAIMDHGQILALDTPARLKRSVGPARRSDEAVRAWLSQLWVQARELDPTLVDDGGSFGDTDTEDALVKLISVADRLGLNLDDVSNEATLETVFFSLTGRGIRE